MKGESEAKMRLKQIWKTLNEMHQSVALNTARTNTLLAKLAYSKGVIDSDVVKTLEQIEIDLEKKFQARKRK